MNLRSLFFLFCLLPVISLAQKEVDKFAWTVYVSPQLNYRQLFLTGDGDPALTAAYESLHEYRQELEAPLMSGSAGASFLWNFNPYYSFETGIQYADYGYKTDWILFIPSTQNTIPDSVKFNYHFGYAEIPLKLHYCLNQQFVSVGLGLNPGYLLNFGNTFIQHYPDGSIERDYSRDDPDYFSRFSLAASIHLGIQLRTNSVFSFRIEPFYKHQLLKIIDAPLSARMWSAGISLMGQFNPAKKKNS